MKINFDRICRLAGVQSENKDNRLNEAGNRSYHEDPGLSVDKDVQFGQGYLNEKHDDDHEKNEEEEKEKKEGMYKQHEEEKDHEKKEVMNEDSLDEIVEVDPEVLMEEIRRAKKMMALKESKKSEKKESLNETHLKRIIRTEIQNILSEIDQIEDGDSSWLYGKRKPKYSKKGYTNQGRIIPGVGFKKQ